MIIERLLAEIMDENGEVSVTPLADNEDIDPKIEAFKEIMKNLPIRFDDLIACIENDSDLENLDRRGAAGGPGGLLQGRVGIGGSRNCQVRNGGRSRKL